MIIWLVTPNQTNTLKRSIVFSLNDQLPSPSSKCVLGVQNTLSQLEFDRLPFGCDLGAQITLPRLDPTTSLLNDQFFFLSTINAHLRRPSVFWVSRTRFLSWNSTVFLFGCDLGAQITLPYLDLTTSLLFVPRFTTCAAVLDCIRL